MSNGKPCPDECDGRIQAIWIKRMSGGPMDPALDAELVAGRGILGNADQGGKRQVTIISEETWDGVMEGLGAKLDPSARRANLMVRGISLENSRGRILHVGDCRIHIYGETRPCRLMEETLSGLQDALKPNWGGGAYGEVLDNGHIMRGDAVYWEV